MRTVIGWFLAVGLGGTGCGLQDGAMVKTGVPSGNSQGQAVGQPEVGTYSVAYRGRDPGGGYMGRGGFANVGMGPGGDSRGPRPPRGPGPYMPGRGPWTGGGYLPPVDYPPPEVPTYTPPPAMSASPYRSREELRQAAWRNWWRNTPEGRKDYWERLMRTDPYGGKSPMEDPEAAGINFMTDPTGRGRQVTPPSSDWPPVP